MNNQNRRKKNQSEKNRRKKRKCGNLPVAEASGIEVQNDGTEIAVVIVRNGEIGVIIEIGMSCN